jgi:hypothetical protein
VTPNSLSMKPRMLPFIEQVAAYNSLNSSGLPGRRRQVDEHDLNAGLRAH